jgi:rod shape-determining protein MreD
MTSLRVTTVAVLVVIAVTIQVGWFAHFAWQGVVPDLALLVVVAAALVKGPEYGAVLGFTAGLLVDLAPPADHTAGRWALALAVAGYLAGLTRLDGRNNAVAAVATVAGTSFVATSLFALSGLALGDPGVTVDRVLTVIPVAVLYDVLLTPFVVPLVIGLFHRLEPLRERW